MLREELGFLALVGRTGGTIAFEFIALAMVQGGLPNLLRHLAAETQILHAITGLKISLYH